MVDVPSPWPIVRADVPIGPPPAWAVLQRRLFDALDEAWRVFAARYTEGDGRLIYRGPMYGRDGVDDFYEAFFNWPTLYVLGGADDLLAESKRHWEGVTRQLTELDFVRDEYERGYDWFHQGESMLFFYALCLADPHDEAFRARAERFAGLYLGGEPGNYDPEHNLIRAPHNGVDGPRWGLGDGSPTFPGDPVFMAEYGLPLYWVDGIDSYEAMCADKALLVRMGQQMAESMGRGDTAVNLAATGLALNAYLLTGREDYREWLLHYVDGWVERMAANDGVLPDNVGLTGKVGEYFGGRWYGGNYGWTWPHGFHSVGTAAAVAAVNAATVSGDDRYLDLGRSPIRAVLANARKGVFADEVSSLRHNWTGRIGPRVHEEILLVPNRHGDHGWFDFQPMQVALPTSIWAHSQSQSDWNVLRDLVDEAGGAWHQVRPFRDKEEAGHEGPWLAYLAGDYPAFPEDMLRAALHQVARRLDLIGADGNDPATIDIHHWQNHNPVVTEALLQLTTGAPQVLYNGGAAQSRLRYHDADRRRPGLPPDVAALVDSVDPAATSVTLVNLSGSQSRRIVVQAGAFAQHRFDNVRLTTRTSAYPGSYGDYIAPDLATTVTDERLDGTYLEVVLPPNRQVRLELAMTLSARRPSYRQPWDGRPGSDDPS